MKHGPTERNTRKETYSTEEMKGETDKYNRYTHIDTMVDTGRIVLLKRERNHENFVNIVWR